MEPFSVRGSATSEAAAQRIKRSRVTIAEQIFQMTVDSGGYGITCCHAEHTLGLKHQTASARIRELVLADCLVRTGYARGQHDVYVAAPGAGMSRYVSWCRLSAKAALSKPREKALLDAALAYGRAFLLGEGSKVESLREELQRAAVTFAEPSVEATANVLPFTASDGTRQLTFDTLFRGVPGTIAGDASHTKRRRNA